MRIAELVTAAALALFALICMVMAADLPVGWVEGAGPGGGAFPFWLSAIMLGCALAILAREARAAPARAGRFIDPAAAPLLAAVVGGLVGMVALIEVVGFYVAAPLFLLLFLRFVGKHGWGLSLAMAAATPVAAFLFFEATLRVLLPKGVTETLFYPLYAFFF